MAIEGFTKNKDNVWGHCEESSKIAGKNLACFYRTTYRCNICRCFVCVDHQKLHLERDHPKEK